MEKIDQIEKAYSELKQKEDRILSSNSFVRVPNANHVVAVSFSNTEMSSSIQDYAEENEVLERMEALDIRPYSNARPHPAVIQGSVDLDSQESTTVAGMNRESLKSRKVRDILSLNKQMLDLLSGHLKQKSWNNKDIIFSTVLYVINLDWIQSFYDVVSKDDDAKMPIIPTQELLRSKDTLASRDYIPLHENVTEDVDYVYIPKEAWEALVKWYGATVAITRNVHFFLDSNLSVSLNDEESDSSDDIFFISKTILSDYFKTGLTMSVDSQDPPRARMNSFLSPSVSDHIHISDYIWADCGAPKTGENSKLLCFVCHKKHEYKCNGCRAVLYCSRNCQVIHWSYHKLWCKAAAENNKRICEDFVNRVDVGTRGRKGVINIGNSCYLNSSLQCLGRCGMIVNELIADRCTINEKSVFGTKGDLARAMSSFLKEMWLGTRPLSPSPIKSILGRVNEDYLGMSQQDAHEATLILLEKLHEDLNTVTKKPYVEKPEGDGSNDDALFEDSWNKHLLRENSLIQDAVGGMIKTTIKCLKCQRIRVNFDYYQSVQLPVPSTSSSLLPIVLYPIRDSK